jgi:2,4-dienoyl-CoA reductase-like NADH-dependent reductase (Old Yellow Enzyme family)
VAALFTPLTIGDLTLRNRIVVPPMCQYSAEAGSATSWHTIHLGQLALSGAGMLTIEATAVEAEGRITYGDLGLYSDDNERALGKTLEDIRRWSDMPVAIQLAHAGRKASSDLPWLGGAQIPPHHQNGWQTAAPSDLAFTPDQHPPQALDRDGMTRVREAFVLAAQRAKRIGIAAIQLHGAHGYLLHSFLSPISNLRNDAYGGDIEGRMRFPLEVFDAVRQAFDGPVMIRISSTDWAEGGWTLEDSIVFAQRLKAIGCDAIDCSSGGSAAPGQAKMTIAPGYQVPFAREIRKQAGVMTGAVGMIVDFDQAEAVVALGDADFVSIGRGMLYDPHWPWRAAAHLGETVQAPPQYLRAQSRPGAKIFA